jgi:hypothetical protein
MKKKFSLLSIFCILLISISFAQDTATDTLPPYKKITGIPSFNIITPDSIWYNRDSLPKNKPFVIIYFSPECGHCQYEAKEIVKHYDELKNITFLWVSFHPLIAIQSFREQYGVDRFSNMIFGRDPKYFLPAFFKVEFTPFIAVYNASGNFVKEFREGAKPEELLDAIK